MTMTTATVEENGINNDQKELNKIFHLTARTAAAQKKKLNAYYYYYNDAMMWWGGCAVAFQIKNIYHIWGFVIFVYFLIKSLYKSLNNNFQIIQFAPL